MGCVDSSEYDNWWNEASDIEKINALIQQKIVAFRDRDNPLVGVNLYPVVEMKRKRKWIRAMSEDGLGYYKKEYFDPILNFCKVKEWFVTEERTNKRQGTKYRLLVGLIEENKYVLLAPIHPHPEIREVFGDE